MSKKILTVKELKKELKKYPDKAPVCWMDSSGNTGLLTIASFITDELVLHVNKED